MKTISIKQPWASLIVENIKPIENRTWPTKFRGRVLIHASAQRVVEPSNTYNSNPLDCLSIQQKISLGEKYYTGPSGMDRFELYEISAIIGSVEIVDCVINHNSIWAEKGFQAFVEGQKDPIHTQVIYNWVLANPVKFDKPIPVKGKLSFWEFELPEEYMNEIERKLQK